MGFLNCTYETIVIHNQAAEIVKALIYLWQKIVDI
jgi:hypothetical protein